MIDIPTDATIRPLLIDSRSVPAYCCLINDTELDDGLPWYHDIYHFLILSVYLEAATAKDRRALRQLATQFVICGETLYRRSVDGMLLLWFRPRLYRSSYEKEMSRVSDTRDLIHVPSSELHALTSPWPFSVWGIDIIRKISSKSSSGHEFILVTIDYFTKWVKAASYARLTSSGVASFIRLHIICRYGVLHELIPDRRAADEWGSRGRDKNIKRILWRMVETSRDWSEKLTFALWPYRTSFRTSTRSHTLLFWYYGMEAVLPVKIEMDSLRVALEQQIPEVDWAQARFDQLNLLNERRLRAARPRSCVSEEDGPRFQKSGQAQTIMDR
ncbi:hypothetical protein CK203_050713 [Vitis vinifera]|uniref:Integrase catalytic domain-containing protein n=1 Tax=Vitis vinifera TaxID=29760 RepID=A0A438H857_VITVI|nr:hypothetical protein CK203_050713 [Vitis vinifera]